eukprot:scaffold100031_cov72-Phaeocystis_antarctica.AAC.4
MDMTQHSLRNLHPRLSSFISQMNRPSLFEEAAPALTALRGWSNLITSACPLITERGLPGDA